MKKMMLLGASLLIAGVAHAGHYDLDGAHGDVSFAVKHMMISNVKGRFQKFSGGFEYDSVKKVLKGIKVEIDPSSVVTMNDDRDKHLKSPDFLDVAKFNKITFVAEKSEFKADKPVKVMGDLTIHGVTKPVTLDVSTEGGEVVDPWGKKRMSFTAKTTISRKDFGLTWNKAMDKGGVVVADEVKIEIEGEAVLQEAKK